MERYKLLEKIGKGAHGLVFKAEDLQTGVIVAIKQISVNIIVNPGLPKNVMREISTLRNIQSDYIVDLIDVFNINNTVLIVMECLQYSLSEFLLNLDCPLSLSQVKCCSLMILKGLQAIHRNHIMHRDLKPSNVLINDRGILKIVDFGLSCIYDGDLKTTYTHQIGTRWYRAPELLYGSQNYTPAIDIWAIGCIIAELLNNQPLFPGETDIGQLAIILSTLGTPTTETWPQLHNLPDYNKIVFTPTDKPSWDERFIDTDPNGVDLIRNILIYDYTKRLTADEVLNHRFFFVEPLACTPLEILQNYKITNSLIGKSFEEAIDIGAIF